MQTIIKNNFKFIFNKIDNHLFANLSNAAPPNLPMYNNLTFDQGQQLIRQRINLFS